MAYITRSFVCNKIIQAATGFPIGGRGLKPSEILPLIKICPKKSDSIEYFMEVNVEGSTYKPRKKNKKEGLKDLSKSALPINNGSEFIKQIQADDFVTSAYYEDNSKSMPKIKFKVCNKKVIKEVLNIVCDRPDSFWKPSPLLSMPQQNVIVEFSSPNIAKPFHMGHLRSTIIGNFISNLYQALGHNVTRLNYLGDWGKQFGLLKYGYDLKKLTDKDLKDKPLKSLYELYVWINKEAENSTDINIKANEIFNLMEHGDEEHLKVWNVFRDLSIKDFEKCFRRLNVTFDEYHGESMYKLDQSKVIIEEMEKKDLLKSLPDGRKVYFFNEKTPPVTILKSDGSTLYLTRDISAAIHRQMKYKFDRMFYVVDNSQHEHFLHLKRILIDLGYDWANNIQHVNFGRIVGMSTRKGNTVFLEDVLDEAKELTLKNQMESENTKVDVNSSRNIEIADVVGASSLIFGDLKKKRRKDYEFSWDDVLESYGETGSRLQYSHCRLVQLEENCGHSYNNDANLDSLIEPEVIDLVRHLARFDEILHAAYEELEANKLALYLYDLSFLINKAYKILPVKETAISTAEDRLKLFKASRLALAAGMKILGISPLDQM